MQSQMSSRMPGMEPGKREQLLGKALAVLITVHRADPDDERVFSDSRNSITEKLLVHRMVNLRVNRMGDVQRIRAFTAQDLSPELRYRDRDSLTFTQDGDIALAERIAVYGEEMSHVDLAQLSRAFQEPERIRKSYSKIRAEVLVILQDGVIACHVPGGPEYRDALPFDRGTAEAVRGCNRYDLISGEIGYEIDLKSTR